MTQAAQQNGSSIKPIRRKLSSGLEVIYIPEKNIPIVTVDLWVAVGSGDEIPERAGISHFLEHMLFKGTEKLSVGEYERKIENLGGYLNAATSFDYTHYFINVPTDCLHQGLEDFADVVLNSKLVEEEVESERSVILEEIRRKIDSPFGFLFDEAIPSLYSSGPYQHPIIGYKDSVSSFTRAELLDHYRRFYTAENMYLILSGDFDLESTHEKLEALFQNTQKSKNPYRESDPPTAFLSSQDRYLPMPWQQAYFIASLTTPVPENDLKNSILSELSDTYLSSGRTSPLRSEIVEKRRLAHTIGSWSPSGKRPLPFLIYGMSDIDKIDDLKSILNGFIRGLQDHPLDESRFTRAKRQIRNSFIYGVEGVSARARLAGDSLINFGDVSVFEDFLTTLEKITFQEFSDFFLKMTSHGNLSWFISHAESKDPEEVES